MDGIQYWSEDVIQHIKKQESKILSLTKENEELKVKIKELEKRLVYYENPHTPPSARKLSEAKVQDTEISDEMRKRGAPKGHRGSTRLKPEPDEIIDVTADACEKCGSRNIQPLKEVHKNTIEDFVPTEKKVKATQFDRHKVKCLDCGHEFISKHPDCPQIGNFGIYLLVYVTMLKFHLRGVLRKTQDFLFYDNGFEISTKGIHDILLRVGDACRISYEQSIERIRNATWVHIDETGIKINGEKYWLWIFRTDNNDILVVIRRSRGRDVLWEILGENWDKPIIVDGWKAYWNYRIVQRCWAHLLREIDTFKDISDDGKELSETIHHCFNDLKEFLSNDPSLGEREKQKTVFDNEMKDIVENYSKCKELHKPTKYLQNGLGKWYTCLLFPGMEPTNNLGEQAMREHVIMRKIIGCFRSKNGAENYQYIASLLASWKLQDKNIFEELENLLRQELCLSIS
jgi:transposase